MSYSLITEIERIDIAKGCIHEVWVKSNVKDYAVLEEVRTPHCDNLGGIKLCNQEVDIL